MASGIAATLVAQSMCAWPEKHFTKLLTLTLSFLAHAACGEAFVAEAETDAASQQDAAHNSDAQVPDASDGAPLDSYAQAVLADKPIGYWRLDEKGGSVAFDFLGQGINGHYKAGVVLAQKGALTGNAGVKIEGVSEISFGDHFAFEGFAAFSLEGWFRPTTISGAMRYLFRKRTGGTTPTGYHVAFRDSTEFEFFRYVNGNADGPKRKPLPTYSWSHVVATFDGDQACLYVDGIAECKSSTKKIAVNQSSFVVANFVGGVDELAVYNQALTPERVKAHFQAAQ